MKKDFFKNALKLSAEELTETINIKAKLTEIIEKKDIRINVVRSGFQFLEVEVYDFPTNCTFQIKEDVSTSVKTSAGYVTINNEIGNIILSYIKDKQQKNEFINIQLMPLC